MVGFFSKIRETLDLLFWEKSPEYPLNTFLRTAFLGDIAISLDALSSMGITADKGRKNRLQERANKIEKLEQEYLAIIDNLVDAIKRLDFERCYEHIGMIIKELEEISKFCSINKRRYSRVKKILFNFKQLKESKDKYGKYVISRKVFSIDYLYNKYGPDYKDTIKEINGLNEYITNLKEGMDSCVKLILNIAIRVDISENSKNEKFEGYLLSKLT